MLTVFALASAVCATQPAPYGTDLLVFSRGLFITEAQ